MKRIVLVAGILAFAGSCQTAPERLPLPPIPEDAKTLPYDQVVLRARLQATAANEAFFVNQWSDLEDAARGLEQAAHFLGKASDVPAKHKDTLASSADELAKQATELREAAKNKDVKLTNQVLQRINLKVRELHPD